MTLLASAADELIVLYNKALEKAERIAEQFLAPAGPLPRSAIHKLVVRAKRNGMWFRFPQETRALLRAALQARIRVYRSQILLALLRKIWLKVELASIRGKAILAAITYTYLSSHSSFVARSKHRDTLIAIGLQVLNHPLLQLPAARIYSKLTRITVLKR